MRLTGILAGLVVCATAAADPAPDLARAKDLYKAAEDAVTAGRYADAVADYGAVYDITRDPVLFYKIASANEKAGHCDVALVYYRRYLAEARPSEAFAAQTAARITACGGAPSPTGQPGDPGPIAPPPDPVAGSPAPAPDAGPSPPVAPPPAKPGRDRAAWLCVSGSIAFVTVGAVLAYSANAAEKDVSDLYVGLSGRPPEYDPHTRSQYEALVRDGRRYEVMSWVSFGVAGLAAVAAASLFLDHGGEAKAPRAVIAPTVTPAGGGVAATVRF